MPNMKPRSGQVTDGIERAPARGMLAQLEWGTLTGLNHKLA
jgi:dihydroxy-acid dehydratase